MQDDILKEVLLQDRHDVGVAGWKPGGTIENYSKAHLPFKNHIIGYTTSEAIVTQKYLNSGGRGILIEHEGHYYKLKGIDPYGYIVAEYAYKKNKAFEEASPSEWERQIKSDDALRVAAHVEIGNDTVYTDECAGKHMDSPFGVLTLAGAQNEKNILDILEASYENRGYLPAQKPAAIYIYDGLDFETKQTASILTELPVSLGSDLRLNEMNTWLRKEFEVSKKDGKRAHKSKRNAIQKLYENIYGWLGSESRMLNETNLLPTKNSSVASNFCVRYMNEDCDIGISRVDHSSTMTGAEPSKQLLKTNTSRVVDGQNPFLLDEYNYLYFLKNKLYESSRFGKNFNKGWDGNIEPLNDYIDAVRFS